MKRNFVKALLFGAMVFAASPVFVGCTDYDDDIERLQGEIDKINGEAPVSQAELTAAIDAAKRDLEAAMEQAVSGKADDASVVALREKVDALEQALAGKGDASEISSLIEQIQGLQEAVNNVPGSLDALKAELEQKIAALEEQIGAGSDDESVIGEITKLRNELQNVKKMAEDNGKAITELQQSLSQIKTLESKVSALETASDTYKQQIAAINTTLGTLATKTELATKVTLAEVNTAIETYLGKSSAEVKAALAKITELENYKNNVLASAIGKLDKVSGEDLGKLSQALTDISTLKNQYTDLLNAEKEGSIAAQLKALNAQYGTLETQISELGIAVKAMIQSISYIPEYADGEVRFKSLWFRYPKNKPTNRVLISPSTAQSLKFRISPASAAQALVDDINNKEGNAKYAISFLGESVKTRGASSDYVDIVSAKNNGDGVIELKANPTEWVSASAINKNNIGETKYYSLCMNVVAVTPEGDEKVEDNLTNVSSDYFVMQIDTKVGDEIFSRWNPKTAELKYDNTTGYDLWTNMSTQVYTPYPAQYILTDEEKQLLSVEFYLMNKADAEYFEISGNMLKMKADKVGTTAMIGKQVEVSRKVSFKGYEDKFSFDHSSSTDKSSILTITIVKNVAEQVVNMGEFTPDYTKAFAKDADMVAVQNATGLTANEYTDRFGTDGNNNVTYTYKYVKDGKVATGVQFVYESNKLTLKVDQYTQIKDAIIAEATFQVSDLKSVTVKATVNPSTMPDALTTIKRSGQWDGDNVNVNLPVTLTANGKIGAVSLAPNFSGLYVDYAANKAKLKTMNGAFTVTLTNDYGAVLSDDMTSFDLSSYQYPVKGFKPMEIVAQTTLNGEKKDENKGSISLTKFGGTVEVTKTSVTFTNADLASTFNLNEGMTWKDYRGKVMWKNGAEYRYTKDADNKVTNADSEYEMDNILAAYRLTAPTFAFKDAASATYFDLTSDGKVSLTAAGQSAIGATPTTAKVIATFQAPWGNINGTTAKEVNGERVYTVELTVVLGGK